MRMPASGAPPAITRKCCGAEEERVQPERAGAGVPSAVPGTEAQLKAGQGGGQPVPVEARRLFEPRFGHDFGQVRLHTDSRAAGLAASLHASAFTLGNDVYFASGRYAPATAEGQRLLAHELTHVLQQNGRRGRISRTKADDDRKTIVATALGLATEHYLMGAAGQIPGQGGGINTRKVILNAENHCASIDVDYGPKRGGVKTHVCGGRYSKVTSLPEGDPANAEHQKDPSKYRWSRTSDGDVVSGEACEGKRHFDCGGFVSYCYHQACPDVTYPGPASNLLTSAYGWTAVSQDQVRGGDVAYRSGHAGLCINSDEVMSALGKKWGVHKESKSKYSQFGYLGCLKEAAPTEEVKPEGVIMKEEADATPDAGPAATPDAGPTATPAAGPAFPVSGRASCFCDAGDSSVAGGTVACGGITCPEEATSFAAWPNLNDRCRTRCAEGPNVPRKSCGQTVTVTYGGNSVSPALRDCGPNSPGRVIDLSLAAVKILDPSVQTCRGWGTRQVTVTA
jgi:hypothetical protein